MDPILFSMSLFEPGSAFTAGVHSALTRVSGLCTQKGMTQYNGHPVPEIWW